MTISTTEYMEYLDLLETINPEFLEKGFNKMVQEKRCAFGASGDKLIFIETLVPYWNEEFKKVTFDTEDVSLYIEKTDGSREILDVEM